MFGGEYEDLSICHHVTVGKKVSWFYIKIVPVDWTALCLFVLFLVV